MKLWQPSRLEEQTDCPYLPGRRKQYEFFLATDVGASELSSLLAEGWRKFGPYFFRPRCSGCRQCIPLRVPVQGLRLSRSQRRVLRRNDDLRVSFVPLRYSEAHYEIYRRHSEERFAQRVSREDFLAAFYQPSCPVEQIELHLDDHLLGVGFLDRASDALSSVYFCFDPRFSRRNLGTFSILKEIDRARTLGLDWYYLGYFVPGCPRMAYKDHFRPRQYFSWASGCWREPECSGS